MNGEMAEPPPITIKNPNSNNTTMIGANQNFFLSLRKPHKSIKNSIFRQLFSYNFFFNFFPNNFFFLIFFTSFEIKINTKEWRCSPTDGHLNPNAIRELMIKLVNKMRKKKLLGKKLKKKKL